MATFNTKKTIIAPPSLIPEMGNQIVQGFIADGFEVNCTQLSNGGCDISITKGGMFKAVLDMKTALKVLLTPQGGNVYFDASVGIFGQQSIPTIISMFFFWPLLIAQLWGLIGQSKLDDKALKIAEGVAQTLSANVTASSSSNFFCIHCGASVAGPAKFCPECGAKL